MNTGNMYRAMTWAVLDRQIDPVEQRTRAVLQADILEGDEGGTGSQEAGGIAARGFSRPRVTAGSGSGPGTRAVQSACGARRAALSVQIECWL